MKVRIDRRSIEGYKLGIILPTNNPKSFFEYAFNSFKHLKKMTEFGHIKVLFNFQPPWDDSKINLTLDSLLSECKIDSVVNFSNQESPASMFRLRGDAAALWPEADFYMFADDNMVYSERGTAKYPSPSWERYEQCIEYMMTFPSCGILQCEGSLGGDVQKMQIRPSTSGLISTTRGLFFRNVNGGNLYSPEAMKLAGGMEETVLGFSLMERGFFFAKQFNNPTQHKQKSRIYDNTEQNHITNYDLLHRNAERYIRERYDADSWTHDSRKVPKKLWELFKQAGGDEKAFGDLCKTCGNEVPSEKYWRNYK